MTYTVTYSAESKQVTDANAVAIVKAAASWADTDTTYHFDGVGYDRVNDGLRLSLRITDVTDVTTGISGLQTAIDSINSNTGSGFPPARGTASVVTTPNR
jgi:hypothetical protein